MPREDSTKGTQYCLKYMFMYLYDLQKDAFNNLHLSVQWLKGAC